MPSNRTEDLERNVAEERARVDATLDEVQRRLTPGQLIDEVLHHGRGAGTDFAANLGRTLAANPIPTALVGVGLMWLLLAPKPTATATTEVADTPGTRT
jgi:hypothetical protein